MEVKEVNSLGLNYYLTGITVTFENIAVVNEMYVIVPSL